MNDIQAVEEHLRFDGEWRRHPRNPDKWIFWRRLGLNGPRVETCRAFIGEPRLLRASEVSCGLISHKTLDIARGV